MPNWCFNVLAFTAPPTICVDFERALGRDLQAFDMDAVDGFLGSNEHGFAADELRDRRWGTKWNVEFEEAGWETTNTGVVVRFNTAWTPPLRFVRRLSKKFPAATIRLDFDEPGVGFSGTRVFRGGVVVESTDLGVGE